MDCWLQQKHIPSINSSIKNQFPKEKMNGIFTFRTWLLHSVQLLLLMESRGLKILIIFMSDLWYLIAGFIKKNYKCLKSTKDTHTFTQQCCISGNFSQSALSLATTLNFLGWRTTPNLPSRSGRGCPAGISSLNLCKIHDRKRKSSIFARASPRQTRTPAPKGR